MGRKQKLKLQRKLDRNNKKVSIIKKAKIRKIIASVAILSLLASALYGIGIWFNSDSGVENTSGSNVKSENEIKKSEELSSESEMEDKEDKIAVIETEKGNIKIELYSNSAPKTVENFVKLSNDGFYNETKFHRVIKGFIIQGGDPLSKDNDPKNDGTGGPGYTFEDEINPWSLGLDENVIKSYEKEGYKYRKDLKSYKVSVGAVAMANSGPNTNGSQFFIVTEKDQPHLDGRHTVFGKVVEGMDVVRSIEKGDIIKKIYIAE